MLARHPGGRDDMLWDAILFSLGHVGIHKQNGRFYEMGGGWLSSSTGTAVKADKAGK